MSTAEIQVQYVNGPKGNPDFGSLKLRDGSYVSVPKGMLSQFTDGGTYEVSFDLSRKLDKNGNPYRTVRTVKQKGAAPIATNGGGKYGATDDVTARRIFICGILNGLAHAGKLESPTEAQRWWNGLEIVWENVHKPKITTRSKEVSEDELGDSIPY